MRFLAAILNQKKAELKEMYESGRAKVLEKQALHMPPLNKNFSKALFGRKKVLIAEFKRASPSRGMIRRNSSPEVFSRVYEEGGASAISVLTDAMFKGALEDLKSVKENTHLPVLRKDFIIDKSQIYESRVAGADAILLIVSVLINTQLKEFLFLADTLGIDCVVECHSKDEIKGALLAGASIIGINARDLRDFSVHPELVNYLSSFVPDEKILIAESGIKNYEDIKNLPDKVNGVLVGEILMSEKFNPSMEKVAEKVRELVGKI